MGCLSAEMRSWELAGHPVVGYWVHVGDLQLEEDGQLDWVPFKENSELALPLSGLGNYVTVHISLWIQRACPQTALARPEWCSPP